LRQDGTVERARLAQSTGDPTRDKAIEAFLSRLTRISQPPPAGTPQPISIHIGSRA
jgi:outer membrane biosynthesis protein TonB